MNDPAILVTGGSGTLGSRVARRLRATGREVRVLSRSGRPGTVPGDLSTGGGLEAAVAGVGTVVHCASSPRKPRETDVAGTERLLRAAGGAGVGHLVYVSIVGVDRNPYLPYYRAKLEAERLIERSSVPWTVLRATQFHEFVLGFIRPFVRLPVVVAPKGFLLQPIDVGEVADRLVELACSAPAGRAPDVGGPEVATFASLARTYLGTVGRGVLEVPVPGKMARVLREGALVAPERKYGKVTWGEFLDGTARPHAIKVEDRGVAS